jgi:hypothetical protein
MPNYTARFQELLSRARQVPVRTNLNITFVDTEQAQAWYTSALNLLEMTFGRDSTLTKRMYSKVSNSAASRASNFESSIGLFSAAKEEYELGFIHGLRREISDEFTLETCLHAESLLKEGNQQSAAVLVAAALEDCFKRRAADSGMDTDGKTLTDYLNYLKTNGILAGASAKLASAFPKFRNAALHAEWTSINDTEIQTISTFLKSFALQK